MRIAVIDLGTNTFNLLVGELQDSQFVPLFHDKKGVMLGEGGINSGTIAPAAYQRALDAIKAHHISIKRLDVQQVRAIGTSAIRSADNGSLLVQDIRRMYGIEVDVIDGHREAELIFKGVSYSLEDNDAVSLIMDIGGGSNEFIICRKGEMLWKRSFPLGMSRVLDRFRPSDPISEKEHGLVERFFEEGLVELWNACEAYKPQVLIGASGAFDTYRNVLFFGNDPAHPTCIIPLSKFYDMHNVFLRSTLVERRAIRGMDELRVVMIVLASMLISLVLRKTNIQALIQSNYSLKEGVVVEMLDHIKI
jgi:exopolyphosphatase/guanosine-5'-triphosphate,3'-diphosphate pyrophosphatase